MADLGQCPERGCATRWRDGVDRWCPLHADRRADEQAGAAAVEPTPAATERTSRPKPYATRAEQAAAATREVLRGCGWAEDDLPTTPHLGSGAHTPLADQRYLPDAAGITRRKRGQS